jgi:DNA-directed RNA polymerase subunit RPC12/RpoP
MRDEKHTLPQEARIAEGGGQCGRCLRRIWKGDTFWWRGDAPVYAECVDCRSKRLVAAKLDREVKG